MISILQSIIDIIVNLVEFVIQFIQSFIDLFLHIPLYISFITNNLTTLPNLVIPFITASISIYVIFLLIGRNAS